MQEQRQDEAMRVRELAEKELLAECRWEAFRGSGPGGQKRNKTSSAVRIVHLPSGLAAIAAESRSQAENRQRALQRLRHRLALELRQHPGMAAPAVPEWFASLRGPVGALRLSVRSERYLAALGLVMDVLAAAKWRVSEAAAHLGLSTAGLVRFLEKDPKAWAMVNASRARADLPPLTRR